jgi:hypothetical protein
MVVRPQWEWRFDDASGSTLERPVSPVFTTQFDAEQWLGEHWRSLAEQGVHAVALVHDGEQATAVLVLR